MAGYGDWDQMEYRALMGRGSDAERTSMICWVAAGLTAAVLLSWGVAARSSGLMLPVVFAVAFGFYAMIHGRQQVRLIAGYVREFFEASERGPQWFTRLGHLEVVPGFNVASDWTAATLANCAVAAAVVLAWVFAPGAPKGDLMAGLTTGCGVAFAFHSISETARLRQTNPAAFWRQVGRNASEERPGPRAVAR
ncbi:MAG TPA: hypothetical protein VFM17_05925 [Candidatus Eisenbacteria bacterium]|jgi:hypothetical protein|nr:hypothetical protein [Candidatus Eisenbacteria bacterium]